MRRRAIIGIGGAALIVLGAGVTARYGPTAEVEAGRVEQRVVARASVEAEGGVADVFTDSDGRVLRVLVREGDRVVKDQLLAELAPEELPNPITAPIAGTVLSRNIDPGDNGSRTSPVAFRVADTSKTELRIEIEQAEADRVAVGQLVKLGAPGGGRDLGEATITRVSEQVERRSIGAEDPRARADGWVRPVWATWKADSTTAPHLIGARMEAQIIVATAEVEARVPRSAVQVRGGRPVVMSRWLLWARERSVELGVADSAYVEVRGVAPDTTVFLHE